MLHTGPSFQKTAKAVLPGYPELINLGLAVRPMFDFFKSTMDLAEEI